MDGGCCDEVTEDKEDSEEKDWETSDNDEGVLVPSSGLKREYSPEEKEAEAVAIGYKVVGPLEKSDQVFKLYEPVFTIVQVQYDIFGLVFGDEFHGASCSHGFILCRLVCTSSRK